MLSGSLRNSSFLTPPVWEKFSLASDHEPSHWIESIKEPGQRLVRWRLKLQEYDHTFKYKPEKLNSNASASPRNLITETKRIALNPVI